MGKKKRQKLANNGSKKNKSTGKGAKPTGITKSHPKPQDSKSKPKQHLQTQHTAPTIPFAPSDRILLIGEGDLSFARSLVECHACSDVTATVFESKLELEEKYPHAGENIEVLEESGVKLRYGVDAMKNGPLWKEVSGRCDRVFFNFPHVGGKSKDVNRQVRYNQGMCSSLTDKRRTSVLIGNRTACIILQKRIVRALEFDGELDYRHAV
jgi:25S rRNA (uracil2634-N3)-methyltransferase